eukprot:5561526-Alexandrium_andersonii.AAC.1
MTGRESGGLNAVNCGIYLAAKGKTAARQKLAELYQKHGQDLGVACHFYDAKDNPSPSLWVLAGPPSRSKLRGLCNLRIRNMSRGPPR